MKEELKKNGINLTGLGTDGDSRCQKTMKMMLDLGVPNSDTSIPFYYYFYAKFIDIYPFQDHEHILSRFRKRLLRINKIMRIGRYKISMSTLKVSFFVVFNGSKIT